VEDLQQQVVELRREIAECREALQRRDLRYRTLLYNLPQKVVYKDRDSVYLSCNKNFADDFGLTPEQMVGKTDHDLYPHNPAIAEKYRADDRRIMASGEAEEIEESYSTPTQKECIVRIVKAPVKDEHGSVTGILGIFSDITDRKRAEEALKKAHDELERRVQERTAELLKANEELAIFHKFAEASGQGFSMAGLDGHLLYLNPALCRMLGEVRPEEFIGKHLSICYSEESNRQGKQEAEPALWEHGHWEGELSLLRRDGKLVSTRQNSFLMRDESGSPFRMAVVITDITERKHAEEALRQSEEKYRGLLEACPDAVLMTDLSGKVLFASRQTWELLGAPDREEIIGQSVFDHVIEDDRRRLAENFPRLVETGVRRQTEYTALRHDGTPVPTEISSALNRNTKGEPMAVMAVIRDITERKLAEKRLQQEHRTLKHLLQASDHERQIIAYEIHDGLAQQLAGAIMQFQTFEHLKDKKPRSAAKAYEAAMTMLQQGHFEARRLIAGVRPPILDELGVGMAVSHLVNEQNRLQELKVEYRSEVSFGRLVPALENAIYRIAQEGLANACQHSKSEKVRVSLVQQGDRVRIEVRDWGIGFDPKAVGGDRFGLEGIRQRARLLGGKCSIRSTAGNGTRIAVDLPVVLRD
jgi:PAS domain S-box-containing protein